MKVCLIAMEVLVPPSVMMPYRRCKKTRRGKKRKCKYEDEEEFGYNKLRSSPALSPQHYVPEEPNPLSICDVAKDSPNKEDPADAHEEEEEKEEEEEVEEEANRAESPEHALQANRRFLRPLDVPKAPSNSTQFIIDDHENCNLYFSFESPRPTSGHNEFSYEDQCYWDIDYEYESPDDVDTAFFERDFEMIYNRAREEELLATAKTDLIEQFAELEERATNLEDQLSVNGTVPLMDISYFQGELLRLQEENLSLRRCNRILKRGTEEDQL